jgi:hypothetical protein
MRHLFKPKSWILMFMILTVSFSMRNSHAEQSAQPTQAEIKQAVSKLKEDPNLADEEKKDMLHWVKDKDEKKKELSKTPGWLRWLWSLFGWLAQTSRVLLWTVIGALVAIVVIFLLRIFRDLPVSTKSSIAQLPTHVRDLDIRPESLPDDIGAVSWQLWQQQQHRGALSLLYRGLLSRLVHHHAVPIKDSSTEMQCMELARSHLQSLQMEYVARALKTWQFAIYGAKLPTSEEVQMLCMEFANKLDGTGSGMEHRA